MVLSIHSALSKTFDGLLEAIRKLEGFEQFLLVPSESELKTLATFGPIVVFNVSEIRSDAFIVTVDNIRFIPLPLLTYTDLQTYTEQFLNAATRLGSIPKIHEVLKWLWDVAVSPVLDELGFIEPCSNNAVWPRVWWVGGGLLKILPIHAAGYHKSGSTRTTIDRVISSYTPNIKALAYARERNSRVLGVESQKIMFVGMPETPNQNALPFVETEIDELIKVLSLHIQTTVVQKPVRESVLSALRDHQFAHFSCHGYSSPDDPSQSRLLLNDWQTSPFTVSDLTALNNQQAQFAYLSACHSASTSDFRLLSESIDLSSAMQLAGYPSVIGTLWEVRDKQSAEVAKDVYSWMLVGSKLDIKRSAESLHRAVRLLRDRTRKVSGFTREILDDPLTWAPYVHIGV